MSKYFVLLFIAHAVADALGYIKPALPDPTRRGLLRAAAACMGTSWAASKKAVASPPIDQLTPDQMEEYRKLLQDAKRIEAIRKANMENFERQFEDDDQALRRNTTNRK